MDSKNSRVAAHFGFAGVDVVIGDAAGLDGVFTTLLALKKKSFFIGLPTINYLLGRYKIDNSARFCCFEQRLL